MAPSVYAFRGRPLIGPSLRSPAASESLRGPKAGTACGKPPHPPSVRTIPAQAGRPAGGATEPGPIPLCPVVLPCRAILPYRSGRPNIFPACRCVGRGTGPSASVARETLSRLRKRHPACSRHVGGRASRERDAASHCPCGAVVTRETGRRRNCRAAKIREIRTALPKKLLRADVDSG
jgi:hypothetical protein